MTDSTRFLPWINRFINIRVIASSLIAYLTLFFVITWFEHRVLLDDYGFVRRDVDKLRFADNQLAYTIESLGQFAQDVGPNRIGYYLWFLVLEIPFLLAASLLVFISLLVVTFNLGLAEESIYQAHSESASKKSRYSTLIHPCYLSILPLLIGLTNGIENMALLFIFQSFSNEPYTSFQTSLAALSARITFTKWILIRLVIALSIMVLLLGWARIFTHRWVRGQPLIIWPSNEDPFVKTGKSKQPPPGLTRTKDIGKKTFNNGKKKKKA